MPHPRTGVKPPEPSGAPYSLITGVDRGGVASCGRCKGDGVGSASIPSKKVAHPSGGRGRGQLSPADRAVELIGIAIDLKGPGHDIDDDEE